MTVVLVLLENLTDATQSVKLHFFFFAALLIDSSNEWWSGHKYQHANGCLRVLLHPLKAICRSLNEACACAASSAMIEI